MSKIQATLRMAKIAIIIFIISAFLLLTGNNTKSSFSEFLDQLGIIGFSLSFSVSVAGVVIGIAEVLRQGRNKKILLGLILNACLLAFFIYEIINAVLVKRVVV